MLITFQSPAFADVMMFGEVAERMIEIIGKEPAAKGIVTVEDLPAAIAKLRAAIDADRQPEEDPLDGGDGGERSVGIAQRALPLLELFEWSLRREVPVVWGV